MLYGKWSAPGVSAHFYHKTAYDEESLSNVLRAAGFARVSRWRWQETEHAQHDDHSQAYWPHLHKENGTHVSLNLQAERPEEDPETG